MGRLFGTDGARGIAGNELTANLAMKIGASAAYVLGENKKIKVIVGMDTRYSGDMLACAVNSGLLSMGADVVFVGVVPTPAVSFLVTHLNADMGVMISASHNPAKYNGIKLFNNNGYKLADEIEEKIEHYILDEELPECMNIGSYERNDDLKNKYIDFLYSLANDYNGLKVVVDCANGSASATAPTLFEKLNVNAEIIFNNPDGVNINDNCGSTHLESLISKVKETGADLGIAYDGDADRCLLVTDAGEVIDGDFILAICGKALKEQGKLNNNSIVGTVMSNLGLRKFCESENIDFVATKVGDRYVLEEMLDKDYVIGGEQSGHVIFKEYANTGDGELTSLMVLNILSEKKCKLSELASIMNKYPQVLVNVNVTKEGKETFNDDSEIKELVSKYEEELNGDGRILIRASGTENLIRVMIEGKNTEEISKMANGIADLINKKFGI
ncbi:MAG: phosphoglucosamine mutase [bacterium]|nr:phosphoglucosamine mutase [bacterium]